jgi:hypothetical protein
MEMIRFLQGLFRQKIMEEEKRKNSYRH